MLSLGSGRARTARTPIRKKQTEALRTKSRRSKLSKAPRASSAAAGNVNTKLNFSGYDDSKWEFVKVRYGNGGHYTGDRTLEQSTISIAEATQLVRKNPDQYEGFSYLTALEQENSGYQHQITLIKRTGAKGFRPVNMNGADWTLIKMKYNVRACCA